MSAIQIIIYYSCFRCLLSVFPNRKSSILIWLSLNAKILTLGSLHKLCTDICHIWALYIFRRRMNNGGFCPRLYKLYQYRSIWECIPSPQIITLNMLRFWHSQFLNYRSGTNIENNKFCSGMTHQKSLTFFEHDISKILGFALKRRFQNDKFEFWAFRPLPLFL